MRKPVLLLFFICLYLFLNSCNNKDSTGPDNTLIANAGPNQTTIVGSYVAFDPNKSTGDFNCYDWEQDVGNPEQVRIRSTGKESKSKGNIQYIGFIREGIYRFRLVVRQGVTPDNLDGTASSEPDEVVITVNPNQNSRFADPNLEVVVRYWLKEPVIELTNEKLLFLDSLFVSFIITDIVSLEGIEHCKNLKWLGLGHRSITDLTPLAGLTKLEYLSLTQNRTIYNISALANLINLEYLMLDANKITDITPLKNLVKLKKLDLQINEIRDVSPLSNMKEMVDLKMGLTNIQDLKPIGQLTNLETLWLWNAGITDISSLYNLKKLRNIHFAFNHIENISVMSNMPELEWCALDSNRISDLTPLKELPKLDYLRLWFNHITDIKPIIDNPAIEEGDVVGLDGNPLSQQTIEEYIPILLERGVHTTW